jgi:hypothetical protein
MKLAELTAAERSLDPHLHVEPAFINLATCLKLFGGYFREYYMARTVKEGTPYAQVFNDHLLSTLALDLARDRAVITLGEMLADPVPGGLCCSTEFLAGMVATPEGGRVRVPVTLPYPYDRKVYLRFDPDFFLTGADRERYGGPVRASVLAQIDIVKPDELVANPLVMGTPSFTHFRNDADALAYSDLADDWFETYPADIDEFADGAEVPESEWRAALAHLSPAGIMEHFRDMTGGLVADPTVAPPLVACGLHLGGAEIPAALVMAGDTDRELTSADLRGAPDRLMSLAATPAELWVVIHGNRIDQRVRETLRAVAVRPHAPRRYCLVDGAQVFRILKAHRRN